MDWPPGSSQRDFADLIAYLESLRIRRTRNAGQRHHRTDLPAAWFLERAGSRPGSPARRRWPSPPTAASSCASRPGRSGWSKAGRSCREPLCDRGGRQPLGARAHRRGARPSLRRQWLRLRLLRDAATLSSITGSAASPPGATSPYPAASSSSSRGTTRPSSAALSPPGTRAARSISARTASSTSPWATRPPGSPRRQ